MTNGLTRHEDAMATTFEHAMEKLKAANQKKHDLCAILDDLFKDGDWVLRRADNEILYCMWCGVESRTSNEIAHLGTCPYARYRKMVEEDK